MQQDIGSRQTPALWLTRRSIVISMGLYDMSGRLSSSQISVRRVCLTRKLTCDKGQDCYIGMCLTCMYPPPLLYDWVRLIYLPDDVTIEQFLEDKRVFFDCPRYDIELLRSFFAHSPKVIHCAIKPLRGVLHSKCTIRPASHMIPWTEKEKRSYRPVHQQISPRTPFWPLLMTEHDEVELRFIITSDQPSGVCQATLSGFELFPGGLDDHEQEKDEVQWWEREGEKFFPPMAPLRVHHADSQKPIETEIIRSEGSLSVDLTQALQMDCHGNCQLRVTMSQAVALTAMHFRFLDTEIEEARCLVFWTFTR